MPVIPINNETEFEAIIYLESFESNDNEARLGENSTKQGNEEKESNLCKRSYFDSQTPSGKGSNEIIKVIHINDFDDDE